MTNQEAIGIFKSIKAGFETDEWMEDDVKALEKGIKALENQKSIIEELEKIKEEISKIDKIYYPDLSFNETGDCYIQRKSVANVIDNHISELKGDNNG